MRFELGGQCFVRSGGGGCVAFVIKRCEILNIPISKIAEASEISVATLQKCLRRLESHSETLETVL
jgi:hypothetical protein